MAYVKSTNINSEENKVNFKRTSSRNRYYLCHYCDRKFLKKEIIKQHVVTCLSNRTCKWCSLVFKNRGNLVTHAYYIHNDKSVKTKQVPSNTCEGCGKSFGNGGLRYHIRRSHYNLVAKITSHDEKQMNEVWYESVLNTDSVVEIKKAGHNLLFIRKLESNKEVRLSDDNVLIDFTSLYPTGNKVTTTTCDICNIEILKRDFKKHYDEKHGFTIKRQTKAKSANEKRYAKIKSDPVKYAIEKEKEHQRYLTRKERKKILSIQELTPRAKELQRKRWRDNYRRYRQRKLLQKRGVELMNANTPSGSDTDDPLRIDNDLG